MVPELPSDNISVYDVLKDIDNVSGSSVIMTKNVEYVVIYNVTDLEDNFVVISTVSLCCFVIFWFVYKKCLDLLKHLVYIILKR